MNSKPKFCITHAPGSMFVCDVKNEDLSDNTKWGYEIYKINKVLIKLST